MPDARLVALDTETTGLDPDTEQIFEVAMVDIASGDEQVWRIAPYAAVIDRMHPKAVEVNRYHERVADPSWRWTDKREAAAEIFEWIDGAHLVGAVPDFDTRHLSSFYLRDVPEVPAPRWHYHLIDIEAMAVGWLHALTRDRDLEGDDVALTLPWRSDDLSRACGVEPPTEDERHTALGDARWVARWYRALTGEGHDG